MTKKTTNLPTRRDPSEVPEVAAFLDARERLDNFVAAFPEVFKSYARLVEDYNAALESAGKAVRAREISCGPFECFEVRVTYDADKLYEAVGEQRFLSLGGTIKTQPVYEVNKDRLRAAIAQNALGAGVAELVEKKSYRYHVPNKLETP